MRAAYLLVALAVLSMATAGAAQTTPIYNDSNSDIDQDGWMDGATTPTFSNTTHYLSLVGTFVVGEDPSNPASGPVVGGLVFGLVAVGATGTSRTGLVGGGVVAVFSAAALSQGANLAPSWVYGLVMMLVAFIGASLYIGMIR